LESLCSKVTTLIIEHGHEKVFKMLRESASHIPLVILSVDCFRFSGLLPGQCVKLQLFLFAIWRPFLIQKSLPSQITQRALMHLHSPAFKMLFFQLVGSVFRYLVMHKNQMITPLEGQSGANVGSRDALLGRYHFSFTETAAYDCRSSDRIYTNISNHVFCPVFQRSFFGLLGK